MKTKLQAKKVFGNLSWYKVSRSELQEAVKRAPELRLVKVINDWVDHPEKELIYLQREDIIQANDIWKNRKR